MKWLEGVKALKIKLMTHMIAGFPDNESSYSVAKALIDGGSSYLEIQFPFSDPSADGPLIEKASFDAIDGGFKLDDGFKLIERITQISDIPVFIMTYANIAYSCGIGEFVKKGKSAGACGFIIPDLPFDCDEGLVEEAEKEGMAVVPVVVPGISDERLDKILSYNTDYIYAAMRKGITGKETVIDETNKEYLQSIRNRGKDTLNILAGFGIRGKEQITMLEEYADCAIVGSAIVERINNPGDLTVYESVKDFIVSLK